MRGAGYFVSRQAFWVNGRINLNGTCFLLAIGNIWPFGNGLETVV